MSQEIRKLIPKFTQEQLDWLDSVFPENLDDKATPLQLARSQGQRHVVHTIKLHVANVVRDINTPRSL